MGFFSDGRLCDEATPVSLANMIGHYKRSKYLAEQEAVAAARAGQQVIILNPTTPIGSGDIKPTPTGRIVVDFLKRKFPAYMDTGLNLVDVDEVARTHVDALEAGRSGERYILGGENLTLKQLLDKMSAITGLPSPTMRVPHSVAMTFALCDQTVTGKLRGTRAACYRGGRAYGQEKDVCLLGQSGTGTGISRGPRLRRIAVGDRLVSGEWVRARRMRRIGIIAAMPGELKPLVQGWKPLHLPHGENAWQGSIEGAACIAVCAGMGKAAAERACAIAMRQASVEYPGFDRLGRSALLRHATR